MKSPGFDGIIPAECRFFPSAEILPGTSHLYQKFRGIIINVGSLLSSSCHRQDILMARYIGGNNTCSLLWVGAGSAATAAAADDDMNAWRG